MSIWQSPLSRATYTNLIHKTNQLKGKSLAQGASSGSLVVLGYVVTTKNYNFPMNLIG